MTKICLTIAGVDPSGGAGIIADIKTFTAFGCYATAAISSITFQNTQGVFGAENQTAQSVRKQIEPILEDFKVSALKTGMLPTREVIQETAGLIKKHNLSNLVVDPVVRSTSGFDLIDDKALDSLIRTLFPLSLIVTPNLPEAERISKIEIRNETDIIKAAHIMRDFGAENVLIKGGHSDSSGFRIQGREFKKENKKAIDYLFIGDKLERIEGDYIETTSTHGTGCTLAAAITANLALGKELSSSVRKAKEFVTEGIRTSPRIGRGNSPINSIDPI